MRIVVLTLSAAGLAMLLGCAQAGPTASPMPSPDELPDLAKAPHTVSQGAVLVPGRHEQPRVPLTPEFKVPELTVTERKALGKEEPAWKPLLYELPQRRTGSPIINSYAEADTRVNGRGGVSASHYGFTLGYAARGWGGPDVLADPFPRGAAATYGALECKAAQGPESAITVGTDRAKYISRSKPNRRD